MDISATSLFGLIKGILAKWYEHTTLFLFGRAYEYSTLFALYRQSFRRNPIEFKGIIDVQVIWQPYHFRRKFVTPMISVRSKGNKKLRKVTLCVTAFNDSIKYQNHVTLLDIDDVVTYTALSAVPFRNLKFDGNKVFTPYSDIKIELLEALDANGCAVSLPYDSKKIITPMDKLEVALGLQEGDVERWGEIYNLEYLEMEVREEAINLRGDLLKPSYVRRRLSRWRWFVKLSFWSKNLVTARQLEKSLELYFKEQKELDDYVAQGVKSDAARADVAA